MYLLSLPQLVLAGILTSCALGFQVPPSAGPGLAKRYMYVGAVAALAVSAMAKPVATPNQDVEQVHAVYEVEGPKNMKRSQDPAVVENRQWWPPSPRPTVPIRPTPMSNGGYQYTTFLIPFEVPDFTHGGIITKYITATMPIITDFQLPPLPPGGIIPLTEAPTPVAEKRQPAPTAFVTAARVAGVE